MTDKYKSFISKPEISFWVPIISSAVLMALSYGALMNKVNLIEQRLTSIEKNQEAMNKFIQEKYVSEETRYGGLALRLTALETLESVRRK